MNPGIDISTLAAAILSGGGIVISLIWKYAPPMKNGNGNGHTRMVLTHDVDIAHIKEDLIEIKADVKKLLSYRK